MRKISMLTVIFLSLSLLLTLSCDRKPVGELAKARAKTKVAQDQVKNTATSAMIIIGGKTEPIPDKKEKVSADPGYCQKDIDGWQECFIERTLKMDSDQCIPSWEWNQHEELKGTIKKAELFVLAEKKGSNPRRAKSRVSDIHDRIEAALYLEAKQWASTVKTPNLLLPFSFYTYEEGWELVVKEDCQFDDRRVNEGEPMKKALIQTTGDIVASAVFWTRAALEGKIDSYLDEDGEDAAFYLSRMEFLSPIMENYSYYEDGELLSILESERLLRKHSENLTLLAKAAKLPVVGKSLKKELRKYWEASSQDFGELLKKHLEDEEYIYSKLGSRVSWLFRRWLSQGGGSHGDDLITLYQTYMARLAYLAGMKEGYEWSQKLLATSASNTKTLKWKNEYIQLLKSSR